MRVVLRFEFPGQVVERGFQVRAAKIRRSPCEARTICHTADGKTKSPSIGHGRDRDDRKVAMTHRELVECTALSGGGEWETDRFK